MAYLPTYLPTYPYVPSSVLGSFGLFMTSFRDE